jgi:hypothetical protein
VEIDLGLTVIDDLSDMIDWMKGEGIFAKPAAVFIQSEMHAMMNGARKNQVGSMR